MTKPNQGELLRREVTFDGRAADTENRTLPASLSSEMPVDRHFGSETLMHTAEAVDLSRAVDGLPLLFQHNQDQPIGLVEGIRVADGKLRGTLRFSDNPKATEVFRDVQGGFLKNISIGYRINEWTEQSDSDDVTVTRWTLMESSIVTVPADFTVGINRAQQEIIPMPNENVPAGSGESTTQATAPVVDISETRRAEIEAEARKIERARLSDITTTFDMQIVPRNAETAALRDKAISEGWTVDQARTAVLNVVNANAAAIAPVQTDESRGLANPDKPKGTRIESGESDLDKFRVGAQEALLVRGGLDKSRESIDKARAGGMLGMSLRRMAEVYLRINNVPTNNLSDEDVAGRAFTTRASGMTTSDFTNLLANTANKSMLMGWDEAPEVWDRWTRSGNLSDFKLTDRVGLSGFSGLDEVPEDGEIAFGKVGDRKERIKLVEYAKAFRLSRRTIINDDLDAFTMVPRKMGRAASRKVGDVTYAVLNGVGPTLVQDSLALFHATHANYTLAATAPTVATLEVARAAMAKKTDPVSGATLNIRGQYLLVPVALETTARVLVASQYDPAGTGATLPPNPFNGRFEVIADARMDSQTTGTTAWVMAADPNVYDTVEVAFLNGVQQPYLREEEEWDTRGVQYVVGIDCGVAALDYRGFHKYRGS